MSRTPRHRRARTALALSCLALPAALLLPSGSAGAQDAPPTTPGFPTVETGLGFGASVPSDPQKSQGEPAVTVDKDGTIYTCGTNGASNGTDHASVSTDGGDQFRLVGPAPTGTIGTAQGGGDCALATAQDKNAEGGYTLAYAGLGPLTGFSTFTSPDRGKSLRRSATQNDSPTSALPGVDRQWIVFTDDKTAFLNYNSLVEGGKVVQKSVDGGLTYGPTQEVANESGRLGQLRAIPQGTIAGQTQDIVYFPYDSGTLVKLAMSMDGGTTWSQCLAVDAAVEGSNPRVVPTAGFVAADHDDAGNIYVTYTEKNGARDTYMTALRAADVAKCKGTAPNTMSSQNRVDPGFTPKVRMNREGVDTTVMPWIAASGAPGRAAVAFYGTQSDGNPDLATFDATWNVYVSQTLDAFAAEPAIDQVKATTHPNHYDSICLNGLQCTIDNADRSLVDYFTMEFNKALGKLVIVYSQPAKVPDAATGNLALPVVTVQNAGESNNGGAVTGRPVLRTSSPDPEGDAIYNFNNAEAVGPVGPFVPGPTGPAPALDLLDVQVGPEVVPATGAPVADGGFTVTMRYKDLSGAALQSALTGSGMGSAVFLYRYVDGYQSSSVAAYYSPATGFTFGQNGYVRTPVNPGGNVLTYPGSTPVPGRVDQAAGTITISVPRSLLVGLTGSEGPGQRPVETPAVQGTRIYDATAFTLLNPSPDPKTQSYMQQVDNAPSMDFLLGEQAAAEPVVPEVPVALLLPLLAAGGVGLAVARRRRTAVA